eukprot:TRINITY_DN1669_c0_g1_i10.p1 TRINITY_DN1669_c0_g1~~TRINITY_DN1669_c0_g1_i10.p1  ORF type:complete len:304 (-),score=48.19 TRINITY_DN1669_c0_g1_i10:717-1628(-)
MYKVSLLCLGLVTLSTIKQASCQAQDDVDDKSDCEATQRGCTCEFVWMFSQLEYKGCNNPDSDPNGLWCMVNLESCDANKTEIIKSQQIAFEGSESESIGYFDYCNPWCPPETGFPEIKDECINGNQTLVSCSCQAEWTLAIDGRIEKFNHCWNPDNDPGGYWCKIDEDEPCDFEELESRRQVTRNLQTQEIISYWDYCNQDCGGLVRPETFMDDVQGPSQTSSSSSGSAAQASAFGGSLGATAPTLTPIPTPTALTNGAAASNYIASTPKISNEQGTVITSNSAEKNGVPQSMSSGGFAGTG